MRHRCAGREMAGRMRRWCSAGTGVQVSARNTRNHLALSHGMRGECAGRSQVWSMGVEKSILPAGYHIIGREIRISCEYFKILFDALRDNEPVERVFMEKNELAQPNGVGRA